MRPILIGPVAAGKSTLLPLVASRLDIGTVDLDDVADKYYEEVGRGRGALAAARAAQGDIGAYRWWQQGHAHAVRRVLADYPDCAVALGAGHTVYEDMALFAGVAEVLAAQFPVLVLPSTDPDRSVELLRARSVADRGDDWILDGVDLFEAWVKSGQNQALARLTVHTDGRSPDEVADEIAAGYHES